MNEPKRPNESGETMCVVRWQVEMPGGLWIGAWDREAFEAYALQATDQLRAENEALRQRVAELEAVRVPDGLSISDANFWLSNRSRIISACREQGFTIVTTASGVQLMRLGEIKALSAAPAAQPEQRQMTDEQIDRQADKHFLSMNNLTAYQWRTFARAVERFHGITKE